MADPGDPTRPGRESDPLGGRPSPFDAGHQLECVEWCPICRTADVLRSTAPPELREQWQAVQREALLTMRRHGRKPEPSLVEELIAFAGRCCGKLGLNSIECRYRVGAAAVVFRVASRSSFAYASAAGCATGVRGETRLSHASFQ